MKVLTNILGNDWTDLSEGPDLLNSKRVFSLISEKLQTENLMLLCGLGTSLYMKDETTTVLAPNMNDLMNEVKSKQEAQLEQLKPCFELFNITINDENVESFLSKCNLANELKPNDDLSTFIKETEKIILERCKFIKQDTELPYHELLFKKIFVRSSRLPRAKLFTTNYDLCFETAAKRTGFTVIDGFSHSYDQEFDGSFFNYDIVQRNIFNEKFEFIQNVFHLYKLHGSVDWEHVNNKVMRKDNPNKACMIYPRSSKYQISYSQPYLEMMSRFQSSLRLPNLTLLILGFGFNDYHLTQPIMSAIKSNISMNIIIVSPSLENSENTEIKKLIKYTVLGDSRITLVNCNFEDFISNLPSIESKTEFDMHINRIKEGRIENDTF